MTSDKIFSPTQLDQFNRNIDYATGNVCDKSLRERHSAAWMRQETALRTKWDEHDNRMRLQDRIDHMRTMQGRLREYRDLLRTEHQNLTNAKVKLDAGLTGRMGQIHNVAGECQTLSRAREGINKVQDSVDEGLRKESELANRIKRELEKRSQEALKLLEEIQRMISIIQNDMDDKEKAMAIDQDNLALTTASHAISLKPNIMELPKAMVTTRAWFDNSLGNMRAAAQLLDRGTNMRHDTAAFYARIEHDLTECIEATDFAYRKRYNETLLAARRLEQNRQNLVEELKSVENDIDATQRALDNLLPSMKLCQTRIANGNLRPNYEMALDTAREGLFLEASNLERTKAALQAKLNDLKARWNDLTEQLHRVEIDLERKLKCLEMDQRAMELRRTTFLPKAEKDVIDWQVERNSKPFSADPDVRYQKHQTRVLV